MYRIMVTVSSVDSFYMSKTPKIEKILNKITYYIYNIYIIYIVILIFYIYHCRQKNCQLKKLKTTYQKSCVKNAQKDFAFCSFNRIISSRTRHKF